MERQEAIDKVLDEPTLSPSERNILLLLLRRCDDTKWSTFSFQQLSYASGLSRSSLRRIVNDLIERKYIKRVKYKGSIKYQPWPYSSINGLTDDDGDHRFYITVAQAIALRADCAAKESELTAAIDLARAKRDRMKESEYLAQVDIRLEINEKLDKYIRTHARG